MQGLFPCDVPGCIRKYYINTGIQILTHCTKRLDTVDDCCFRRLCMEWYYTKSKRFDRCLDLDIAMELRDGKRVECCSPAMSCDVRCTASLPSSNVSKVPHARSGTLRHHSKEAVLEQGKRRLMLSARQRSVYEKEVLVCKKRESRSRPTHGILKRRRDLSTGESPHGREDTGGKRLAMCGEDSAEHVVDMDVDDSVWSWEPPVSPYGLLEEEEVIFRDPWKLLLSCMLLNKTTAVQVRKVIWDLLKAYPTPDAMIGASNEDLETFLQPLGMYRKRSIALRRFSREYMDTPEEVWSKDPTILFGVGRYASDAYKIFCLGEWQSVTPEDKDLKRYIEFLSRTEGVGVGFQRDLAP